MQIKENMVFEYKDASHIKYFIPKELIDGEWCGLKLDKEFNILGNMCHTEEYFNDESYFKLAEKTLDTSYLGDILVDDDDYFYKVNGRIGNIFYLSTNYSKIEYAKEDNRAYGSSSLQELKDNRFKVYQEEKEENKEYSIEELKEISAKALNIDVKDLKIKKN